MTPLTWSGRISNSGKADPLLLLESVKVINTVKEPRHLASNTQKATCPVLLLRRMLSHVPCLNGNDNSTHVFQGFIGSYVRDKAGDATPIDYKFPSDGTYVSLASG
jgi:hypothetical protein